jgi:hypothetical protein
MMKFPERPIVSNILIPTIFIVSIFLASLINFANVDALTMSSSRDCDSNAVIKCGALSTSELISRYNSQESVRTIFHNFGITHTDVATINTTAVSGRITAGGRVLVDGKEVASDAMTAGRQNIAGSKAVTSNGVTFYKRPPSVSFSSSSLPAFVVMNNGKFNFAIIASCGNPVTATPKLKPKATPVPPVTPPAAPIITPPTAPTQTQSQSQTIIVTKPVPTAAPVTAPATPSQPAQIPNTGLGDMLGFGSFVSLLSAGAHYLYKRKFVA